MVNSPYYRSRLWKTFLRWCKAILKCNIAEYWIKMLETNIFIFLFYSHEIHVMQQDFEILTLIVYVDHRWTCDVTLFCIIR